MRDEYAQTAATIGASGEGEGSPDDSRATYLQVGEDWIYTRFHPAATPGSPVAILICGPFGFDEITSYRPLREWARRLAAEGHPTLRMTLPGAGDSGASPSDPGRLQAWTDAVEVSARWLRASSGADTVVSIGIGLGGLLAYRAASAGAPIDGLVLWGTPPRGSELVRRMRAFSRMEASEFFVGAPEPPGPADNRLEAGGFLLSAETVTSLESVEVASLPAPSLPLGVLSLSLDGVRSAALVDVLRDRGLQVSEADGEGFGTMTAHPQTALAPHTAMQSVEDWLAQDHGRRTGARAAKSSPLAVPRQADVLALDGGITEREFFLPTPEGLMRGILTSPPDRSEVCAVFFNAGGVRRVGPNRMWVEASRRWALRGVASVRIDMPGLGESDGPTAAYPDNALLYRQQLTDYALATIDALARDDVAQRFVLVGLCSGGYWALHAGLSDPRVAGIALVNPVLIVWDDGIGAARDLRRVFTDRSWARIRKNATPTRVRAVIRLLAASPARTARRLRAAGGGPPSLQARVDATLERLRFSDTRLFAAFAVREGLADDLERSGWMAQLAVWPNVTIRRIPVNDHTVRPIVSQRFVHDQLDEELDRILAARPAGTARASSRTTGARSSRQMGGGGSLKKSNRSRRRKRG